MGISVIIPVHNSEQYLDKCMESVLTQNDSDIEIILVENGSVDRSVEICTKYTERHSFVRMFDIGPAGVSAARNEGLKQATKEWVTFVDSDDYLLPGAFDVLKDPGAKNDEVIIAGYSRENPADEHQGNVCPIEPALLQKGVLQYAKYERKLQEDASVDYFSIWTCWAKFYRREMLIENKVEFPVGVKTGEDAAFCFQVYNVAKAAGATDAVIYYYRVTEGSAVEKRFEGIYQNNLRLIDYFEGYRKRYMSDDFPEEEYCSYIAGRLIEIVLGTKNESWKSFMKKRRLREIIEKASFNNLIAGKKNSINYSRVLLRLKMECKRYMFR